MSIVSEIENVVCCDVMEAYVRILKAKLFTCCLQQEKSASSVLGSSAAATKELTKEEQLVLQIIAEAGTASIWNRDIRTKSNLSIIQVNKVIKVLESKNLIKEVKG